ncbi:hypothetical protein I7I51_03967 [Histoplasma capsulatum]|uniref:Uncharacterized protein n=1 Tax=Ajellomyces capsulatus TaxID=5037 RepID=A0A8A1M966_AJECA|nr:hypothetical protein I7I51_03967 [Histoplasma capsulatum]
MALGSNMLGVGSDFGHGSTTWLKIKLVNLEIGELADVVRCSSHTEDFPAKTLRIKLRMPNSTTHHGLEAKNHHKLASGNNCNLKGWSENGIAPIPWYFCNRCAWMSPKFRLDRSLSSFCKQDSYLPRHLIRNSMPPSRFTSTHPQRKHLEMSVIAFVSAIIAYFRTKRFGKRLSSNSEQRKATMRVLKWDNTDPESLPIIPS